MASGSSHHQATDKDPDTAIYAPQTAIRHHPPTAAHPSQTAHHVPQIKVNGPSSESGGETDVNAMMSSMELPRNISGADLTKIIRDPGIDLSQIKQDADYRRAAIRGGKPATYMSVSDDDLKPKAKLQLAPNREQLGRDRSHTAPADGRREHYPSANPFIVGGSSDSSEVDLTTMRARLERLRSSDPVPGQPPLPPAESHGLLFEIGSHWDRDHGQSDHIPRTLSADMDIRPLSPFPDYDDEFASGQPFDNQQHPMYNPAFTQQQPFIQQLQPQRNPGYASRSAQPAGPGRNRNTRTPPQYFAPTNSNGRDSYTVPFRGRTSRSRVSGNRPMQFGGGGNGGNNNNNYYYGGNNFYGNGPPRPPPPPGGNFKNSPRSSGAGSNWRRNPPRRNMQNNQRSDNFTNTRMYEHGFVQGDRFREHGFVDGDLFREHGFVDGDLFRQHGPIVEHHPYWAGNAPFNGPPQQMPMPMPMYGPPQQPFGPPQQFYPPQQYYPQPLSQPATVKNRIKAFFRRT